jgi:ABC-2 type transport system ATP-binding protein
MHIELKNVSKSFGEVAALSDVSAVIPHGRKVALIGPNGSGKSTLTRIIMGLLACEGEVRLDGRSPFEHRERLAERLAYVPQTAPQLGASVSEIVDTIATVRGLKPAAIAATAAHLGFDLEAAGELAVRALSGGTRQKLMLALALSTRADLFILDEPTASLDAASRRAFYRLYEEVADGSTLILCSHRLEEIQHLVDHVIALESGRVSFDGSVTTFLESRTVSVIELYDIAKTHVEWLRNRGFNPGAAGAWAKTVTRAEKAQLLAEISEKCDGDFANIVVRDMERVDVPN